MFANFLGSLVNLFESLLNSLILVGFTVYVDLLHFIGWFMSSYWFLLYLTIIFMLVELISSGFFLLLPT